MARLVHEYRCLIISPSDVEAEREVAVSCLARWNASNGRSSQMRLEAVRWETHSHPEMGKPPQGALNTQIVDDADFGVAIFWSRLGTATESHASGSIEEIERLVRQGRPVMVYRCTRAIPQAQLKDDQFKKLEEAFVDLQKRGIYRAFEGPEDFRQQLAGDIPLLLSRLPKSATIHEPVATASRPDIRVVVKAMDVVDQRRSIPVLQISAQNHSPNALFFSGFSLQLADGHGLFILRDSISNMPNGPRRIEPGDTHSIHISAPHLREAIKDRAEVVCAVAGDKLEREFTSDYEQTRNMIETVLKA